MVKKPRSAWAGALWTRRVFISVLSCSFLDVTPTWWVKSEEYNQKRFIFSMPRLGKETGTTSTAPMKTWVSSSVFPFLFNVYTCVYTLTILVCKPFGLPLQLDPLLIHLHHTLQGRLLTGPHLPRQMVDINVLWDRYLSVANGWQQHGLAYRKHGRGDAQLLTQPFAIQHRHSDEIVMLKLLNASIKQLIISF